MRFALLLCSLVFLSHAVAADEVVQTVEVDKDVSVVEGFVVERLFTVPGDAFGSWVSLASDGRGRLIASDQGDKGMYLITPGDEQTPTKVEKLPVELTSVQGIAIRGDVGYAVVNGRGAGLYKLTASQQDGRFDNAELLINLDGGGEHGPHAVRFSPAGDALYVICGNHTKLPDGIQQYSVPKVWGEDHLLPQLPDPNGHAVGRMAPGGYIIKCDFDGQQIELVSTGYRNAYDMDFNADGELFAYDADMEWDLGLPWYRPTRLCHAVPGSEFGWRNGSGKWPVHYEDSLPAVVDIGPGSPTGVEFGYGLAFPEKFQRAIYLLDWTFGTMYAVSLVESGQSYTGQLEEFLSGKPLPLTDCAVGDDGHLYFTTGGRNTQSHLYRVRYVGDLDAKVRSKESLQTRNQVTTTAGELASDDRFDRYAARVALEHQGLDKMRSTLAAANDPMATAQSAIALARHGAEQDLPLLVDRLAQIDLAAATPAAQSAAMRAMALVAIRLGPLDESAQGRWRNSLSKVADSFVDFQHPGADQWYELMVYLGDRDVVASGVAVMERMDAAEVPDWGHLAARSNQYGGTVQQLLDNMPPVDAVHLAFILRNAREGWNQDLARRYFEFFPNAVKRSGGNSYAKHLANIRSDAIANLPINLQVALGEVISAPLNPEPLEVAPPQGPGREWNADQVLASIEQLRGCNFDRGRNLFHATGCIRCHRFNGEGEAVGPDLSTVANKFSKKDLVESLVEPSKTISDQYGSHQVITVDGRVLVGRVVELGDEVRIYTQDFSTPPVIIGPDDIDEMTPSKVSQMPTKLLDELNEDELRDLMAYLLSGGNARAPFFRGNN
jgi:putative heme-binding domain-containing protein